MSGGLYRLPCGGFVTGGEGGQINRITRIVGAAETQATFILLHPPTSRRLSADKELSLAVEFARNGGYGSACVLYLFPYRAAHLGEIKAQRAPTGAGPANRGTIDMEIHCAKPGSIVIAAWGDEAEYQDADKSLIKRFDGSPRGFSPFRETSFPIHCFGLTVTGRPVLLTPEIVKRPLLPLFGDGAALKPRRLQAIRLQWIEETVSKTGGINRGQVMRRFNIGRWQAGEDIHAFMAANPGALAYDHSAKMHRRAA
jgi:hypothetical protein